MIKENCSYFEAIDALKNGKSIRRKGELYKVSVVDYNDQKALKITYDTGNNYRLVSDVELLYSDIISNYWIIEDERQ